jgi:hypothetical protein
MRSLPTLLLAGAVALAAATPASNAAAQLVADPAGDFLASYVGPRNGDLDVLGATVFFDGATFRFASRSAGSIGTTAGALFVWGVDRGRGTARFGPLAPGVLFDAVVVLNPGGTSTVNDLITGTSAVLPVGAVAFAGADLRATVPASLLPTLAGGFAQSAYTANLWPRVGAGNNNQISDFAPDNSNLAVNVVPEPATALLLLPAAGVLAAVMRRRRAA